MNRFGQETKQCMGALEVVFIFIHILVQLGKSGFDSNWSSFDLGYNRIGLKN